MTVTIMYGCKGCGARDVPVEVKARGADEDIVAWVEGIRVAVGKDHALRSPLCGSSTCDLKIPLPPGDGRIGDPTTH